MAKLMQANTRLSKSLVNVATGGALQILTLLLNFAVRIAFVRVIGYSYLGISSLFSNILTILSVADLGFGTSISISLYAALKKADEKHIAGIVSFYKKVYLIIGSSIFIVGCAICPFISFIVNTTETIPFLELYFFIYLVNLVSTYFVSYRHAIIKADQKNGILNIIHSLVLVAKSVIELLIILILPRFVDVQFAYTTYLIVMVLSTYAQEIWSASIAKKMYPYAFVKTEIPKEEKKEISKNVKSLLLYKICRAVNISVDSILISIMVSTTVLGKYSNYILIINVLMGFGCLISRNSIASLGNFVLSESKERQIGMFNIINFVHIAIAAFFVVNYVGILEPFFHVAFGLDSTLSILTLAFTAIHLGFSLNYEVNELFRETTKMFRKIPYISAINLVLNIGLSTLLGYFFGLEGILAGTLISYFLTSFWFETFALFKYYFKASSKTVWLKLGFAVLSIGVFSTGAYFITTRINLGNDTLQLLFAIVVSVALSIGCVFSFAWLKEFKTVFNVGKRIITSIYEKINSFLAKEKVQLVILILGIVSLAALVAIRDLFSIEMDKFIFVILVFVFALLLKKENFLGYLMFVIPFHSGLPTKYIYPLFAVLFILKNLKMFKNWRLIINYLFIPGIIGILEIVLSLIYGEMTSFNTVLLISTVLLIFAFVVYDKKSMSLKPLKLFVLGACVVGLIILCNQVKIAHYMSSNTEVETMTFTKIMTKTRFGDIAELIYWTEFWTKIEYPINLSMFLGDNPNYIGLLMLCAIMSSAYLLFNRDSLTNKVFIAIGGFICLALGIYTGSKSFFICLMIFALMFIAMLYGENKIKLWVMLLILGIVGGATAIALTTVPFIKEYIIDRLSNDSGRFALIADYFKYIFSSPLTAIFGVSASQLNVLPGLTDPPHCSVVQVVGGYGLVGFSIIIFALVLTIMKARPRLSIFKYDVLVSLSPMTAYLIFTLTSQIFLPPTTLILGLPIFYIYISRTNTVSQMEVLKMQPLSIKKRERLEKQKTALSSDVPERLKILITGAAGFIGYSLSKELLNNSNHTIVGVDNFNNGYDISLKKQRVKALSKSNNFKFIKGDIADKTFIDKLFKKYRFDVVVNLASRTDKRSSVEQSDLCLQSNVISMYYLLEACRYYPVRHFVFASSVSSADKDDDVLDLVNATTKSSELLSKSYSQTHNIPMTCVRLSNVYGPYGRPDKSYFIFTKQLVNGQSIKLFNSGKCQRDFVYIDNVTQVLSKIVKTIPECKDLTEAYFKTFEIGTGRPIKINSFVQTLADALKANGLVSESFNYKDHIELVPSQKGLVLSSSADISQLKDDFGYKPSTSLSKGLDEFVRWYKSFYKNNLGR